VAAYNGAGTAWAPCQSATTQSGSTTTIDHPVIDTQYLPQNCTVSYVNFSGSLFGSGGPVFTNVHQGAEGDCWLMSSLAAVAARDPADIVNMFQADGTAVENGVTVNLYKVRFFNSQGVANYVVVDSELPEYTYGGSTYVAFDQVEGGPLWVALAEKAYAQADGKGWVSTGTGSASGDSYAALNGGLPSAALQAITGKSSGGYAINPANMAAAWNAGDIIVLGSSSNANDNLIVGDSEGTHAYAVVNYTASSGTPFELYNPWGLSSVLNSEYNWNGHEVYAGPFNASSSLISQDFAEQFFGSAAALGSGDSGYGAQQFADHLLSNGMRDRSRIMETVNMPGSGIQAQGKIAMDHLFSAWGEGTEAEIAVRHLTGGTASDASAFQFSQSIADESVDTTLASNAV
jgi:hypothetical protein